jgi:hypothetical protein
MSRVVFAAFMAASLLAAVPAAHAQDTPADFTAFNAACAGASQFLLGDVAEGTDPATILTPLCGCLDTGFKDFPQADIDILAVDLRGEGTDELHAAHGSYDAVEEKARDVLNTCYASPEVMALMAPPENPPPADPATPAEPAPADPAAAPAQ